MRIPLTTSAWIEHEPTWIPRPEADALLEAIRHELAWEQREVVLFGRRVLQPRLIAWAGDLGYRYSGQTLEPRALRRPWSASCGGCASALACPSTTCS